MSWSPQYNHFTLDVFSIHSVSVLGVPRPDLGLEVLSRPAAAIQAQFPGAVIALEARSGPECTARGSFKAKVIMVPPWDSPVRPIYDGEIIRKKGRLRVYFLC
jgi:hypothetical protein